MNGVFSTRRPQVVHGIMQVRDVRMWARVTFRVIRLTEERFALALVEDLTAEKKQLLLQKKHNEQLRLEIIRRKEIEERLAQSEKLYRQVVETANDAIYRTDKKGLFTYLNPVALHRSGYSEQDLIGQSFLVTVHPEYRESVTTFYVSQFANRVPETYYELPVLGKHGETIWIGQNAQLLTEGYRVVGFQCIARDITDRRRAEDRLKASLKEKEVLMREIHHRVKNNFQVISGLLALQAERIDDETYQEIFKNMEARIGAMALVHERLYESDDLADIRIDQYIMGILHDLISFPWEEAQSRVTLKTDVESLSLGADTAIPVGLIITELVANSLKYAFPKGQQAEISVGFHRLNDREFELLVSDNGVGMPDWIDPAKAISLGFSLVAAFVAKLHGEIQVTPRPGTHFRIRFRQVDEGGVSQLHERDSAAQ
ncbi:MAG: PAS domain S-box protein [Deltaproteobacteria bacterium]|nr:PAS domain S-box protein [Deltaproteobacteria bacterium]